MKRYTHRAMDTAFAVSLSFPEGDEALADSAAQAVFDRIDALETLLTRFSDTSDTAVIRALAPGETAVVSPDTMAVLVAAAEACAATFGAFDPTAPVRNFSDLSLDPGHMRVGARARVSLDFGGIGKGYALDAAAEILESGAFGVFDRWLLDAGTSTVRVKGTWTLGVGGPWKKRSRRPTAVTVTDGALSGSGFEVRGEHVYDVRRGGAARLWGGAWARARTATQADAFSTASLSLSTAELRAVSADSGVGFLVARRQPVWLDRLRDPLVSVGAF